MFEDLTQSVIDWADGFGLLGLAIVSATEAALQPVPPDLLVMPMSLAADNLLDLLLIFTVVTLSSVIGSLGGYAIGLYGGRPLLVRFAKPATSRRLGELISRYGWAGIFVAALSPIPYKVLAWTAGAGRMDLRIFIAAGLFGRSIRFGLEVMVLGIWGEEFLAQLENPWFWLALGMASLVAFFPLSSWWYGLGQEPDAAEQE
ncbi:MAG: VTT domain-containing protein [Candidatus Thalassarchaeaceae archaeon]|nr:VTT domain-containing protein [Candidatus Thalassarchaeaceae archaeon]